MTFDASMNTAAVLNNLPKILEFVRYQAVQAEVPETIKSKLDLVVEELFVNIVKYSYEDQASNRAEVEIRCRKVSLPDSSTGVFSLTFKDFGPPFNPLEQQLPSLDTDLDERQVGGLGIYLTQLMADSCSYTRKEESNLFEVCFHCIAA